MDKNRIQTSDLLYTISLKKSMVFWLTYGSFYLIDKTDEIV